MEKVGLRSAGIQAMICGMQGSSRSRSRGMSVIGGIVLTAMLGVAATMQYAQMQRGSQEAQAAAAQPVVAPPTGATQADPLQGGDVDKDCWPGGVRIITLKPTSTGVPTATACTNFINGSETTPIQCTHFEKTDVNGLVVAYPTWAGAKNFPQGAIIYRKTEKPNSSILTTKNTLSKDDYGTVGEQFCNATLQPTSPDANEAQTKICTAEYSSLCKHPKFTKSNLCYTYFVNDGGTYLCGFSGTPARDGTSYNGKMAGAHTDLNIDNGRSCAQALLSAKITAQLCGPPPSGTGTPSPANLNGTSAQPPANPPSTTPPPAAGTPSNLQLPTECGSQVTGTPQCQQALQHQGTDLSAKIASLGDCTNSTDPNCANNKAVLQAQQGANSAQSAAAQALAANPGGPGSSATCPNNQTRVGTNCVCMPPACTLTPTPGPVGSGLGGSTFPTPQNIYQQQLYQQLCKQQGLVFDATINNCRKPTLMEQLGQMMGLGGQNGGLGTGAGGLGSGYGGLPTCGPAPAQPDASGCQNGTWRQTYGGMNNTCAVGWQCVPGSASSACGTQPTQPDPSGCPGGSYSATYGGPNNACITSWTCNITNAPTATLTCLPAIADVGSTITISYSCSAGTATATGFSTSGGSPVTVVATDPPAGTNTANFGLTCVNHNLQSTAQCSVQEGRPSLVFLAVPSTITSGANSSIAWTTSGMKTCVVSSPDLSQFTLNNANSTAVNGAVSTGALATTTNFAIHCITVGGNTKDATVQVVVQ